MMKHNKMDISQSFSSDCLLFGPDILFDYLAIIFRAWLTHGHVSKEVLSCAFIPLLKSNLKDPSSTDSYRAIAGSSLVLQVFERTILLIWGDSLSTDSLQFGFKKMCSTTTATLLLLTDLAQFFLQSLFFICP